jgi:Fungal N-terminal domain of STAND proteins
VTIQVLEEYKALIANTKSDLEDRLETIDDKMQSTSETTQPPEQKANDQKEIQEEKDSATQCLEICAQVSVHLDQVRRTIWIGKENPAGGSQDRVTTLDMLLSSRFTTAESITNCESILKAQSVRLKSRLDDIDSQLQEEPKPDSITSQAPERENIEDEYESTKQSLAMVEEASQRAAKKGMNYYEDIQLAEDTRQVIVSTFGDLISAKSISVGARSVNYMGQMSDASLQQLAKTVRHAIEPDAISVDTQPGASQHFESRYGTGIPVRRGSP